VDQSEQWIRDNKELPINVVRLEEEFKSLCKQLTSLEKSIEKATERLDSLHLTLRQGNVQHE